MAQSSAAERLFGDLSAPSVDQRSGSARVSGGDLMSMADAAAERHGVDPRFFRGIIQTESSWNPGAIGPNNYTGERAIGLGQVMPSTARGMGYNPADLADPEVNLDASARYVADMLRRSRGDHALAARMYNAGPNGKLDAPDVIEYGNRVFTNARRFDDTGGTPDLFRGFSAGLRSSANDMTTGMSGYSSAAQGFDEDAAASYSAYRERQRELDNQARPQDQSFREALRGGAGEFFGDYLPYTIGNALGSSASGLGGAAAGAGTGFMVAGPPGAVVGGIVGGALPLLTQYMGSTWADSTEEKLRSQGVDPDQATLPQIQAASGMTAGEFARVTGAAAARAGVEGVGDIFLGGLGGKLVAKAAPLLPKGLAKSATDLLSKPTGRVAGAALGEGITETADVPLSDLGAWRPASGPGEYLDAFAGGVIGGGGARGGFEAARNPGAITSGISNIANKTPMMQERYRNRMGGTIDSVVQTQVDARNAQDTANEQAEAERNRTPSVEELHTKLIADWQAEVDSRKPAKITEEEYNAEVDRAADALSTANKPLDKLEKIYPHLATFAAYKKWVAAQRKAQSAENPMPEKPSRLDAIRYRQALLSQQGQSETKSGSTEFSPELVQRGQRSGWKASPSARAVTQAASDRFVAENTLATPLLPNYSAEDSLRRAEEAQQLSEAATDPNEKAAYAKMAEALQARAVEQATAEDAQKFGMAALMEGRQDEAMFWLDLVDQKTQTPPSAKSFQDVETARLDQQGQIESAQRAAEAGAAERQNMADERNQAYDALESQQAAEKEAQFLEMEKQRNLAQAGEPVFDPGALINQKPGLKWKARPAKTETSSAPSGPIPTASSKPIAGKKLESGYRGGRSSVDLMSAESEAVAPTRRSSAGGNRPSQITPEAAAVLDAQEKAANKLGNLRDQIEQNKQSMLTKALAALRKQGAQIEEGDRLQWNGSAWSLFPPNYRGRPPAGYFYADIFNEAGDKIGKVLRPSRPTPPTPPEESDNDQDTAVSDPPNDEQKEKPKSKRKGSRRVSVSQAQGQSEANDAAQGEEVIPNHFLSLYNIYEQAKRAKDDKKADKYWMALGTGIAGHLNVNVNDPAIPAYIERVAEQVDKGRLEALQKKIDSLSKKTPPRKQEGQAKQQVYEDLAGEEDIDTQDLEDFKDLYFNKSSKADEGAADVKKFLTKKSLADRKANPDTVGSILQHYLDTVPEGPYTPLAKLLMRVPAVNAVPISWTVGKPDELGSFDYWGNGDIKIHDMGGWQTVFHEAIHAATMRGMEMDPELDKAITKLWETTQKVADERGLNGQYGLTSKWEFVSEAFTNPEFQALLRNIELPSKGAKGLVQTIWKSFVDAVNKFMQRFGGTDRSFANVLEAAMTLGQAAIANTAEGNTVASQSSGQAAAAAVARMGTNKDFKAFTDKALDTSLGDILGKGADTLNNLVVGLNNTSFLAKWFPNMKSLQDIHAAETKMQASQGKNANAVMDKVDDIRNLQKPERVKLFNLMLDSTRARLHPDRKFEDKTNSHIQDTPENRAVYTGLARQFNALSPDARKAYQETRDLFQQMFEQRTKALFALSDRILTEKKREQFQANINRLIKGMPGPYFPLTRFGNYVAVWKSKEYAKAQADNDTKALEKLKQDANHYRVSFHESSFQAKRALKKVVAEMGDRSALGENESYAREREAFDGGVTMDLQPLLEKMQDAVETTLGKENSKDAKDALAEIFVSSLADTNVLKSTLKRENIEGVKATEMLQAIARHGSAQAFHISRLENMADIQDALKRLRAEDSVAVNKGERFSIYNTVAKALTGMYTGDPNSFAVRAVNASNFLLYNGRLALSPAFWLTNAMAPLMVSVPYMRGRFKINAVLAAYQSANVDAIKVVMPKGLKDATRFSLLDSITGAKGLKQGERDMLVALMDEGLIDENQIRELANVAQGDIGFKDDVARYLGAIPHRVEALNRVATALTAYRLELGRTKDQEAAVRYALETTGETQVNYTTAGTPYILRKNGWLGAPAAKIITQFMRYQLGMVQLIGHNFREAWISKKVTPKAREEARRKFFALLGVHTAMTGAGGFFGINAATAILQAAANAWYDDDEEPDLEQEGKKLLDGMFGKELSTGIRRGLPAMVGLDLSSRLGMGDMLSIRRENPFRGDAREAKAQFVDMAPALSNLFEWYGWARDGYPMKKIPVSMVSSLAKASEMSAKGMTNARGVVKKGAEDFTWFDVGVQGLGFTPTESAEAYTEQTVSRERDKKIDTARQKLLDSWNNAMADNDRDAVADIRKKITEFNARHKGQKDVLITPDTLTKSRKQRMSREKRMNDYGVYVPKGGEWRNR